MKIIDRYIGGGVVVAMLWGVAVLSLVLIVGNVFQELLDLIVNHGVPPQMLLAFISFVLPFSLTFTIPWGFLTAIMLYFGRLSADNEIIALRANGVSILRISLPVLIVALVLCGFCFWINTEVAPRAEQAMTRTIYNIATSDPSSLFSPDETIDRFPDRRIYIGRKDADNLYNIIVFELDKFYPVRVVHAKRGVISADENNPRLLLKFYDAHFEQRDVKHPRDLTKVRQGIELSEGTFPLSLANFYESLIKKKRLTSYTLPELIAYIRSGAKGEEVRAEVEYNRRFSLSLACLAFALVAIPLSITAHRKETSIGFAFSIAVAFCYFFFIIMADTFRDNAAAHPKFLIWMPNFIFISIGIVLFWRLLKK